MSWGEVLLDGLLGALFSSLITVAVAIYAIRLTQQVDRHARREDLSLNAAERLTAVLLDAGMRLGQLSETTPSSRSSRNAAYRSLANDLRMATNLHAPVLTSDPLAALPDTMLPVLDSFIKTVQRREDAVMRDERLDDRVEDDEYARDRTAIQLRMLMSEYLTKVTDALTAYRRGKEGELPPAPVFTVNRS
jgi:hypothetical protein